MRASLFVPSVVLTLVACDPAVIAMKGDDVPVDPVGPVPDIDVPATFDVGNAIVGETPASGALVVRNVGVAALDVTAALTRGADRFTVDVVDLDVDAGGEGVLTLTFTPLTEGAVEGTLQLQTNDPDEALVEVALTATGVSDRDGDGDPDDCNDADPEINSSAQEIWYDGVDQDCDGASDYDADRDGADAAEFGGSDCDDTDAAVFPGAGETWYDGVDQDCDGGSDYDADADGYDSALFGGEDCDDTVATTYPEAFDAPYDGVDADCAADSDFDADRDGQDSSDYGGSDCDDSRADVYAGAPDSLYDGVDSDCAEDSDYDADRDGYDDVAWGGDDCDDSRADVNPAASDVPYDGLDANCDGGSDNDGDGDGEDAVAYGGTDCDDGDASINTAASEVWYDDVDQDCSGGSDFDADGDGEDSAVGGGADCDDADAAVKTSAEEIWYDGVDQDCSGGSDFDADGDGFLSSAWGGDDCDDARADVYMGAPDAWYDGVDANCDGANDYDGDGDGTTASAYGGTDCDDSSAAINTSAVETCDDVDNDCDGSIDEGLRGTYYADTDSDGYGATGRSTSACTAPAGYVATSGDCDDARASDNPGASEVCDARDNDCDGSTDEGVTTTYYADADGDGVGGSTSAALCSATAGYVATTGDCNDASRSVYPGAAETCDLVDNDCDGATDEGLATSTWYRDADGDGYGTSSTTAVACAAPSGYVSLGTDCDDSTTSARPGLSETSYDVLDNDCDGLQDEMTTSVSTWSIRGTYASDYVGSSTVGTMSDVDGDGYDELVVGVQYANYTSSSYEGSIAFHDLGDRGTPAAWDTGWFFVWDYSGTDWGASWADAGGTYVSVSGPLRNVTSSGTDRGWVITFSPYVAEYLYGGDEDAYDIATSGAMYSGYVYGETNSGYYGYDVASAQFDGSGYNDLIATAPGEAGGRGRVYVSMADDGYWYNALAADGSDVYLRGDSTSDALGQSVAAADFNADGYADLVVCGSAVDNGSITDAGACYVVRGSTTRRADTNIGTVATATVRGVAANDRIGSTSHSLATGDFDGDGVPDLAIGAPDYDGASSGGGGVAIFRGGDLSGALSFTSARWVVNGDGALGASVSLGDVADSAAADLLAGATSAGSNKGVVYLLEGGIAAGTYTLPTQQYASWTGATSGDAFGTSLGGYADIDEDGRPDIVAGARGVEFGSVTDAGRIYVLPGYP